MSNTIEQLNEAVAALAEVKRAAQQELIGCMLNPHLKEHYFPGWSDDQIAKGYAGAIEAGEKALKWRDQL